jgi:hypothetical protein
MGRMGYTISLRAGILPTVVTLERKEGRDFRSEMCGNEKPSANCSDAMIDTVQYRERLYTNLLRKILL